MTRVLLLCGGMSAEHEVSLASARSVLAAAPAELHITPLVIGKTGEVHTPTESAAILATAPDLRGTDLAPRSVRLTGVATLVQEVKNHHVVFPLLHGPYGEDGTIQGLLAMLGTPFVGSGVLGSSVNMDKIAMKTMLGAAGIPQVEWLGVHAHEFASNEPHVIARLEQLPYPLFVKPANLGSSVGISKVTNRAELHAGLTEAFAYDSRVIVERGLTNARELEVGMLGTGATARASVVGEIRFGAEFYDYVTKYASSDAEMIVPANIPPAVAAKVQHLATEAFAVTVGAGIARVDFFYHEQSGAVLLNELNTMPGFTASSMYPVLWRESGVPYSELIGALVTDALAR